MIPSPTWHLLRLFATNLWVYRPKSQISEKRILLYEMKSLVKGLFNCTTHFESHLELRLLPAVCKQRRLQSTVPPMFPLCDCSLYSALILHCLSRGISSTLAAVIRGAGNCPSFSPNWICFSFQELFILQGTKLPWINFRRSNKLITNWRRVFFLFFFFNDTLQHIFQQSHWLSGATVFASGLCKLHYMTGFNPL